MEIHDIKITDIEVDHAQPRKAFENIGELASSILKQGLISPIEVTSIGNGRYRIVDGERRFHAMKSVKLETIPCIVRNDILDVFLRQAVTDFHKEKLNLVEQSDVIEQLLAKQKTSTEIQSLLGIGTTKYYSLKRVNLFNNTTKERIREGKLTLGQITTISQSEILAGKEDEIVEEIIACRANSPITISNIIVKRQDLKMILNEFISDVYYFEKKAEAINLLLETHKDLIEFHLKTRVKDDNSKLLNLITTTKEKIHQLENELEKSIAQD